MDKDKLTAEIKRVEKVMRKDSSEFIHDELRQYLKLLKQELKQKNRGNKNDD